MLQYRRTVEEDDIWKNIWRSVWVN